MSKLTVPTLPLVERTTRFVMLAHLGRERSADAVRDSLT